MAWCKRRKIQHVPEPMAHVPTVVPEPMAHVPTVAASWPQLDDGNKHRILEFLAASPTARANGIARACRESNVKWRRMVRRVLKLEVRGMLQYCTAHNDLNSSGCCKPGVWMLDVLDFANLVPGPPPWPPP